MSPPLKENVLDTLTYVKKWSGETILIKLGGAALQDVTLVESICEDLALIRQVGISLVIVHGGGPLINQELTTHGISWEFIDGQRVTTDPMMDIVEMVLCGQVNRRIVRTLNAAGVPAAGLSGTDGEMLACKRMDEKLGRVGEIEKVNIGTIQAILRTQDDSSRGFIPVIAPVGVDRDGKAFNVNADWAASRIAQSLSIRKILYLTDQEGILDVEGKLISELDAGELEMLIETGVVKGGMLAKTRTILSALTAGVQDVHILNARRPHGLVEELFTNHGVGTVCRLRSRPKPKKTAPSSKAKESFL